MTVHLIDDDHPEAAHAASEYDDDAPRRRWGFSTEGQAADTLADWGCIALLSGFVGWLLWASCCGGR